MEGKGMVSARVLSTIQKRENLNRVIAVEGRMNGGAPNDYAIYDARYDEGDIKCFDESEAITSIKFQCGARNNPNSVRGVIDTDLLEIVRDRLYKFQSGDFACHENACALMHIEEALMWMNRRVEDRIERNVLGTEQK